MKNKDELIRIFALSLREIFEKMELDYETLQEIRLRVQCPILIVCDGKEFFVTKEGMLTKEEKLGYIVGKKEIQETLDYIGNYSLYAYEDEVKQGFMTIQGGHRIGIAGKAVVDEEKVKSVKYISYLNIRLAHQVKGCADFILPYITKEGKVCHTLIISPPRCGKTTLLRDLIRQISNGGHNRNGVTVGVVDERSEIGSCYLGVPQNDLGIRTDILDCCPKSQGMMMLIRSMSPEVVAVDEIGAYEDIHAIEAVIHCGCKLLATVHGSSIADIDKKPLLQRMLKERIFERYIILHNERQVGMVKEIFDEYGRNLYHEGEVC